MSREELDQAYSLIKSGQTQAAINIIEPIIRADRDNENAWWLLANATDDPAARRNALNNVIRLTDNPQRSEKAQAMLQALDNDPYNFEDKPAAQVQGGLSEYKQINIKPARRSGGLSCGQIVIGAMLIIGVCACISVIGIVWAAGPIFDAVTLPETYDNQGTLEVAIEDAGSLETEGTLDTDQPIDGYTYFGTAGETLEITVDSSAEFAPLILVYDTGSGILIGLTQAQSLTSSTRLTMQLPATGEYVIAIRAVTLIGQDMGFGDYTMTFEVR